MRFLKFVLLFVTIFLSQNIFGFVIEDEVQSEFNITKSSSYYITEIDSEKIDFSLLKPFEKNSFSFKYTDKIIWMQTDLFNNSDKDQELILYLSSSLSGFVKLYDITDKHQLIAINGSNLKFNDRSISSTVLAFEIKLPANSKKTFALKRSGGHSFSGKIMLTTQDLFEKKEESKFKISFLYTGAILAILIYNLLIGIYTRKKAYFYYTGFMFFLGGVVLNLIGTFDSFFPDFPPISNYLMMFSAGAACFSMCFTFQYLDALEDFPKAKYLFYIVIGSALFHFVSFPFLKPYIWYILGYTIDITLLVAIVSMLSIGFLSYKKGNIPARFYMSSWGGLLFSALCWFGMTFGILPHNSFTQYSIMWGNVLEMLILSLGLGYEIVNLDRQKKEAIFKAQEQERFRLLLRVLIHDVANPLTVVMTYTKRLSKKFAELDSKDVVFLNLTKIERASKVMSEIIQSVRSQELGLQGKLYENLTEVNIKEVLEDCLFIFSSRLENKNIQVNNNCPEKCVIADKTLFMNHVVSNILSNAIKFSKLNSSIDITCENEGDYCVIIIRDYGVGVSDEQILEFYKKGKLSTKDGTSGEKGTGYGLMLMKTYMDAFGGSVILTSAANEFGESEQGTIVKLKLKTVS